jgi:ABC-2 type transport system ATP-binding protein
MARLADLLTGQGALVRPEGAVGLAVAGIGRTEIGELAYRHGILLHELADRVVEQPAPRALLPASSGRSGHVRIQSAAEPARAAAVPKAQSVPRLRRPFAPVYALQSAFAGPALSAAPDATADLAADLAAGRAAGRAADLAPGTVPGAPLETTPAAPLLADTAATFVHPAPPAGPDHRSE